MFVRAECRDSNTASCRGTSVASIGGAASKYLYFCMCLCHLFLLNHCAGVFATQLLKALRWRLCHASLEAARELQRKRECEFDIYSPPLGHPSTSKGYPRPRPTITFCTLPLESLLTPLPSPPSRDPLNRLETHSASFWSPLSRLFRCG